MARRDGAARTHNNVLVPNQGGYHLPYISKYKIRKQCLIIDDALNQLSYLIN